MNLQEVICPMKNTQTSIRLILYSTLVASAIIGIAFVAGTFYPNNWTVEKIEDEVHRDELSTVKLLGLTEPEFEFTDKESFILATGKCVEYLNYTTDRMNRVPTSIVIAMAGIESAWGKSRFANEGNNLFGIRTWDKDEPYLLPIPWTKWPGWGVKMYSSKCESVIDYLHILNNVSAFKELRAARDSGIDDGIVLADYLTQYASNQNYTELVKKVIKYNIRGEYDI